MSSLIAWVPFLYLAVYAGWVVFIVHRKKRKSGRFPIPEDVLLLRRPGESGERRMVKLEEKIGDGLMIWGLAPLAVAVVPLWLAHWLDTWKPGLLIASAALLAGGFIVLVRRQLELITRFRNERLGLYGERVVADCLEELKYEGFVVIHDVPCLGGGGEFNLDHVVVGHGSVTVIENKTRRKHSPKDGGPDHKVSFDGSAIIWPRGSDTEPVEQVLNNAQWLEKRLKSELGIATKANAIIAIPGWFVHPGPEKPVLVTNGKCAPGAVLRQSRGSLSAEEEKLIARHLTGLCRDVDFGSVR
jgi:hypothetical protein